MHARVYATIIVLSFPLSVGADSVFLPATAGGSVGARGSNPTAADYDGRGVNIVGIAGGAVIGWETRSFAVFDGVPDGPVTLWVNSARELTGLNLNVYDVTLPLVDGTDAEDAALYVDLGTGTRYNAGPIAGHVPGTMAAIPLSVEAAGTLAVGLRLEGHDFGVFAYLGDRSPEGSINYTGLVTTLQVGEGINPADTNGDGLVNNLDIDPFAAILGSGPIAFEQLTGLPSALGFGDINGDEVANNLDIDPFAATLGGGSHAVPESASWILIVVGGVLAHRFARKMPSMPVRTIVDDVPIKATMSSTAEAVASIVDVAPALNAP